MALCVAIAAWGALLLFGHVLQAKPQASLACTFKPRANALPVRISLGQAAIRGVRVDGRLEKSKVRGMYSFDGSVIWDAVDEGPEDPVSGSVWLADDGTVDGLFLSPRSGPSIATLNNEGWLGKDRKTAFFVSNPKEKFSRAADYVCRTHRP